MTDTQGSLLTRLRGWRLVSLSVRARLGLIQLLLLAALGTIAFVAFDALQRAANATQELAILSDAQRFHLKADMMNDALRADVDAALRVSEPDSAGSSALLARTR